MVIADQTVSVLYLDDDDLDQKLMSLHIRHAGDAASYDLCCVSSVDEARTALASDSVDVLVIDNRMAGSADFHVTLSKLGSINPRTMIVVTSSEIESEPFQNLDGLERRPDAIVDKSKLRQFIDAGQLRPT